MGTKVKICGVTSLSDAQLAVDCGAWAVGVNFWKGSPRCCDSATATAIAGALKRRIEVAGVFVNAPLDEVVARAEATSLTMLQLHGDEGPSYCAEARRRTGLKVIKAARVRDGASVRALSTYKTDFHLLDAFVSGKPGGTGERFDWALAGEHPGRPPLILSGGIDPGNARSAIEAVRPFAIDVASGIEASPGRKDSGLLRELFEVVREAAPAGV